jgi:hypothetical protein
MTDPMMNPVTEFENQRFTVAVHKRLRSWKE